MFRLAPALLAAFLGLNAWAYNPNQVEVDAHQLPAELTKVGVDEHLGAQIDLNMEFKNEGGQLVPLRSFFHGHKPVLMAMVYYNCPSLCNLHLNGLTDQFKQLKWTTGRDFEVVAISMDPSETPELAAKKKANYMASYGRPDGEEGWHFLVGSTENVAKFANQVGFRYQWLPDKKQFAHASVAYVITPDGKISRYLHGVMPEVNTIKMSLLEASDGKIGSIVEQVLMFCFQFDPKKGKFTLYAWNLLRIGAIFVVLLMGLLLVPVWRREFSQKRT